MCPRAWKWARATRGFAAWIVAALWYFVGIVVTEAFSLVVVAMGKSKGASLPASLMRACGSRQQRLAGNEGDGRSVSLLSGVALMTSDVLHENEEVQEDSHTKNSPTVSQQAPQPEEQPQQWQEEGSMALIDTACTACMHSRSWREQYQPTLPEGLECSPTPYTVPLCQWSFNRGSGSSLEKGYRGEVFSAEVPSGHTPLLLSISSMAALDMVIHVKDQKVFVNSLNIEMTLFTTKTRHLAIWVAYDPQVGIYDALNPEKEQPKIISEREDLMVYYQEEGGYQVLEGMAFKEVEDFGRRSPAKKPSLGERGVRTTDKRSEISLRREAELSEAASHVQQQDNRGCGQLCREVSLWQSSGQPTAFRAQSSSSLLQAASD